VVNGLDVQVDVEIRPVQMIGAEQFHFRDLGDGSVLEPRELAERQETLGPVNDQVDTTTCDRG
jgi:hypothetical protein